MTFPEAVRGSCLNDPTERKNEEIQTHGRYASSAVPPSAPNCSAGSSAGSNVSALVAKSKKAASSLFTLLHAKNCKLGVHRCSHPGCPEAKLIYLHLKTCNVSNGEPCLTNHKGCADARKLLTHYRRCRDIRSRQVSNRSKSQQHVCLVCSLVARHAKTPLDANRSSSPKGAGPSRHLIPTLNLSNDVSLSKYSQSRHRPRSTSPHRGSKPLSAALHSTLDGAPARRTSPKKMPPPPPRFAFSGRADIQDNEINTVRSASNCALSASSSTDSENPAEENLLGRSLDSAGSFFRARAESLDTRRPKHVDWRGDERTFECDESTEPLDGEQADEAPQEKSSFTRPRSMSYSAPSSSTQTPRGVFDPISEEPVGDDLKYILECEP